MILSWHGKLWRARRARGSRRRASRLGGAALGRSLDHAAAPRLRGRRRLRRRPPALRARTRRAPASTSRRRSASPTRCELGLAHRHTLRRRREGAAAPTRSAARSSPRRTARGDAIANPEFRVRWAAYSGRVVEVGLDGRFYMPVEQGTRVGIMFGVPLAFHLGTSCASTPASTSRSSSTTTQRDRDQRARLLLVPGVEPGVARSDDRPPPRRSRRPGDSRRPPARLRPRLPGRVRGRSEVDAPLPDANADNDVARVWGAGFGVQFRIGE